MECCTYRILLLRALTALARLGRSTPKEASNIRRHYAVQQCSTQHSRQNSDCQKEERQQPVVGCCYTLNALEAALTWWTRLPREVIRQARPPRTRQATQHQPHLAWELRTSNFDIGPERPSESTADSQRTPHHNAATKDTAGPPGVLQRAEPSCAPKTYDHQLPIDRKS